jgi:hypothetical protein
MRRVTAITWVLSLAFLTWAWAAPAPPAEPSLIQKLDKRATTKALDDPKTTLADALESLSRQFDVTFDVNEKAFQNEMVQDALKSEVAATSPIPSMKNVRLATALRKVLSRVQVPSGATFTVRGDHIEITTGAFQAAEIWGEYGGPHLPLVNANLDKTPLDEAVQKLADLTDFNVVLDNRAAEKARTPVSARFRNTPLDTALRLLSDMADLRSVHLDNVMYVTTKENAAALEARLTRESTPTNPLDDQADSNAFKPRKGTGPGGHPKPAPGGAAQ